MGYGVGFRDGRWIGYMVPAECDWPECRTMIDHGMSYQCEEHVRYEYTLAGVLVSEDKEWDTEREIEDEGCGLYFCSEHVGAVDKHESIQPKLDHPRWSWWLTNHSSWAQWRLENPGEAKWHEDNAKLFTPDAQILEELADVD